MQAETHNEARPTLVGIAREASLYDWLIDRSRKGLRPQPLPRRLYADLGLPPHQEARGGR